MKRLAAGAPSVEAHARLVEVVLDAIERVDPRLLPLIKLEWLPRTSARRFPLGTALFVPAGAAYYRRHVWPTTRGLSADERARWERVFAITKRGATPSWAPQTIARLAVSVRGWELSCAEQRADTIAHELAHLSHALDVWEARRGIVSDAEAHGAAWQAWCVRYAGRPCARSIPSDALVEGVPHGAVASLPLEVSP